VAWTAQRTWVQGEVVTAALMNTHLRDNIKAVSSAQRLFAMDSATAQVVANTDLAVPLNDERYDATSDFHDPVTNNTRIVFPVDGVYLLTANMAWDNSTTGTFRQAGFRPSGGFTAFIGRSRRPPHSDGWMEHNIAALREFTAGSYVELVIRHDSATTIGLQASSGNDRCSIVQVSRVSD
jgi:hypothetical protein